MKVRDDTGRVELPQAEDGEDALAPLLDRAANVVVPFAGVVVGELLAIKAVDGVPLVAHPRLSTVAAVPARSTVAVRATDVGHQVVLVFEDGDAMRPIVVGILPREGWPREGRPSVDVESDGESVTVTARRELVLRCGEACITLSSDGKVIVRGSYLLTHATGVNRIKGGSVQIN